MAITRQKKEEIFAALTDKFGRSKSVVFAANNGLSVEDLKKLRTELRTGNIDFQIAKKTLFLKLCSDKGISGLTKEMLDGAVGAAFSYDDQVAPAKLLSKFAKKHEKLALVGAILDGKVLTA